MHFTKLILIGLLTVFTVISSCSGKIDNPFCLSCQKWKLYPSYSCASAYPLFVNENGDSMFLDVSLSKKFRTDGISVCVGFTGREEKGIILGGCPISKKVKCLNFK